MSTIDAPVYEVRQDSDWYKSEVKRTEDINNFFDAFKEKYGVTGFTFYHDEYFGVIKDTEAYEKFKDEVVKNPNKDGIYAFKKRSTYYKEIHAMLSEIEEISPFKPHDVLGINNMAASQWIGERWFFSVKNENLVEGNEVKPINYKDYLQIVMDNLDSVTI
ncbi:hypothetical protein [Terribacillus saccharophilus]|uniref:hypothetical protein n=1 Tax=Terribacillus saccharophilus TaxID=361277 RepID=UPI002989B398|nr:hypothetical protein [Terribacillus saccharophilus]MCM3227540.1 hypothetical protein [Terribacillus saccharophilus]